MSRSTQVAEFEFIDVAKYPPSTGQERLWGPLQTRTAQIARLRTAKMFKNKLEMLASQIRCSEQPCSGTPNTLLHPVSRSVLTTITYTCTLE